jgi:hypothetical protein
MNMKKQFKEETRAEILAYLAGMLFLSIPFFVSLPFTILSSIYIFNVSINFAISFSLVITIIFWFIVSLILAFKKPNTESKEKEEPLPNHP